MKIHVALQVWMYFTEQAKLQTKFQLWCCSYSKLTIKWREQERLTPESQAGQENKVAFPVQPFLCLSLGHITTQKLQTQILWWLHQPLFLFIDLPIFSLGKPVFKKAFDGTLGVRVRV